MNYILTVVSIILASNLFSTVVIVPELNSIEKENFILFGEAFNDEVPLCKTIVKLKEKFNLTMAVETGTYDGRTTRFFESIFDRVDTFECNKEMFDQAILKSNHKHASNYHLGNSGEMLVDVLKDATGERILFYLDAHWGTYWPLRDEFKQIIQYNKDNCIIMIDDIKVPGHKEIGYDRYGSAECSYEYVKDLVDELFTGYKVYFLITTKFHRGKLLIIPDSYSMGNELTVDDF